MVSLLEYSKSKFSPNNDQISALSALDEFFESNMSCFLLKGYAGTGKTHLVKYISEYLELKKLNTVLLAPTGRASRILEKKTGNKSTTIHKGIYNLGQVDEIEISKDGKKKYKFRFNLKFVESNTRSIYLIDESSMISDKYVEDDFFIFGSGRLLKDLLDFIALNNQDRNDQIVFIGDPAQLPPVSDNTSGALDSDYLFNNFHVESTEYELTEVFRQQKESGILTNATNLRNLLQNKHRNSFEINTSFDDINSIEINKVVDTFLGINSELSPSKLVIINHSNKSALEYNLLVRERRFSDKNQIEVGDTLIINQNNYNYDPELLNGTLVKVIEVGSLPELKSGMKSYDENGVECRVTHKFRKVVIEVPDGNNYVQVPCMILENFLYSPNPTLDYAENIALYLDFKIRNPHLKPKTQEFSDALRQDHYFNAVRVKYGYAITCHKAQGGEWDSVIVNLDVNQSKLSDTFLRWTYTAITRARNNLYLFNIPKLTQFSKLKYKPLQIDGGEPVDKTPFEIIHYSLPDNYNEIVQRFDLKNADNFKLEKLVEVLAICSVEDIKVDSRNGHKNQEVYAFQKGDKRSGLKFWYNKNNKFTSIQIADNLTNDKDFASELKGKFEKQFEIMVTKAAESDTMVDSNPDYDAEIEKFFDENHEAHKTLFFELSRILSAFSIVIEEIQHLKDQEVYYLKRKREIAAIQFYYDGINRFTFAQPLISKCNSNKLLSDVQSSISQLINSL